MEQAQRPQRTGIYLGAAQVLANPDYVPRLRDRIGLNLAIVSYAGAVPPEVVAKSPFDGTPLSDACLHALVARHLDGGPVDPQEFDLVRAEVGPSVRQADDAAFRQALAQLRGDGVEIWICASSWTHRRLMYCPSNPAVQEWFEAYYRYLATGYDADGIDLTHARFPMGSFPRGLLACTCTDCTAAAARLGYDMAQMTAALRAAHGRLAGLDGRRLAAAAAQGLGPFDLWQALGFETGVADWFRCRCDLLGQQLARSRQAVKGAAGADYVFGTDTHPASLASFVGHDHTRWAAFSDFASPLVSHISAFVCDTLIVWARWLRAQQPALTEAEALQAVYRLVGYGDLELPTSIAGYELDHPERLAHLLPLEELILCDLTKARLWLPPEVPSYPIIHGTGWPRPAIDAIVRRAAAAGHDGIMWQGTDELMEYSLR
ncbi:MAG: hypothetical protein ABIL09_19175 [Gemmatimonadota bacterium]